MSTFKKEASFATEDDQFRPGKTENDIFFFDEETLTKEEMEDLIHEQTKE